MFDPRLLSVGRVNSHEKSNVQRMHIANSDKPVTYYSVVAKFAHTAEDGKCALSLADSTVSILETVQAGNNFLKQG